MTKQTYASIALAALLALSAAPGLVAAVEVVSGQPTLSGTVTHNEFTAGTEGTVKLYVQNDGDVDQAGPAAYETRVQTARATTLSVSADGSPIQVHTKRYPAGNVRPGTNGPYPIDVTVPEGTDPGTYYLTVTAHYDHTASVYYQDGKDPNPQYNGDEETETFRVPVVVRDRAAFSVVDTESNVAVAQRGTYSATLKNTGTEVAKNAVVTVTSKSSDLSFGSGGPTATATISRWEPGQTRTVTYSAAVADAAGAHNYSVSFDVYFDDADGVTRQSRRLVASLRPRPEQTFAVRDVTSSLRIGRADGTVSGTVVNEGGETVHDATLVLAGNGSGVRFDQRTFALPTLDPGESAHFSFSGGTVPDSANVSSVALPFVVRYDNQFGDRYAGDTHEVTVDVAPAAELFTIEAVGSVPAGTRGDTPKDSDWTPLTVQVTNNGDQTLHDVRPSIVFESQYFQRPIESNQRSGYIATLQPGETKNVTFAVSASSTAGGTTYPLSVRVDYEEQNGVSRRTNAYTVPVHVAERSSLPLLPIGGGAVILGGFLVGGFIWWRRDPN
ncbi:MAG: COG1361 S-layer family protein [Haloarculaceae archaeon]